MFEEFSYAYHEGSCFIRLDKVMCIAKVKQEIPTTLRLTLESGVQVHVKGDYNDVVDQVQQAYFESRTPAT